MTHLYSPRLSCLAAISLASLSPLAAQEKQPTYWGKSVDGWRQVLREGKEVDKRVALEALASLAKWAKPAAPDIVAAFNEDNTETRAAAQRALLALGADGVPSWIELVRKHPDDEVRKQAMDRLAHLGPQAKEAAPFFVSVIREAKMDGPLPRAAARALGALRVEARALAQIFLDRDLSPTAHFHARNALTDMREAAAEAAPLLLDALKTADVPPNVVLLMLKSLPLDAMKTAPRVLPFLSHDKAPVRLQAAETLAALNKLTEECRPKLLELAQKDKDPNVRMAALAALASFPDAKESVPLFLDVFRNTKTSLTPLMRRAAKQIGVRLIEPLLEVATKENKTYNAIFTIAEIGQPTEDADKFLRSVLKSKDVSLRIAVLDALPRLGASGAKLFGEIVADRDANHYERTAAAQRLSKMKEAAAALPSLREATKDENDMVAFAAWCAMAKAGDAKALDEVIAALGDKKRERSARATLVEMGAAVTGRLLEAFASKDATMRQNAVTVLSVIGPAAKEALPAIERRLKDEDDTVRAQALVLVACVAPDVRKYAPLFVAAAKDKSREVRVAAVSALGREPQAAIAVPALLPLLADENKSLRATILAILGGLGPEATDAGPAVVELLKDPDKDIQESALRALDAIGPAPDLWVAPVSVLLASPNLSVRERARTLLKRHGIKR